MKKMSTLLILIAILISCNKKDGDQQSGLIAKYKLVEVLADPGDGSGTFQPVNSSKTIEFYENGKLVCNGDICKMSIESNVETIGTYSMNDSTFCGPDCDHLSFSLTSDVLIIHYPCIEPCGAKYVKQLY